jgi:predicted dehydrogenase
MAWGSYADLVNDRDVDAVYISLPNSMHHEWAIKCLRAGKHVLCEKPIAANRARAVEMFDVAQQTGRLLIEAFMYRCHPGIERVIELVRGGAIGRVKIIRSHFTFNRPEKAEDVRYQKALAGGSIMDVGCYTVNFARALTGEEPVNVHGLAHQHGFGVDDFAGAVMQFPSGVIAVLTCGMTVQADRTTYVGGAGGYLSIDTPWFTDGRYTIVRGEQKEFGHVACALPPYALEAQVFAECVSGKRKPWITREDSLGNMAVLDAWRKQI